MKHRVLSARFALGALLAATACGGEGAGNGGGEPEPPPELYPVGVRTVSLVDDSRTDRAGELRLLRTELWYPAVPEAADAERDEYDIIAEAPEDLVDRLAGADLPPLIQDAARDADVETRWAPYPLIVFSHGKNGLRYQTHSLMTHLASRGFVVAAPDHRDDTLWELIRDNEVDPAVAVTALADRPEDVSFLADRLGDPNGETELEDIAAITDTTRMGISGHSFGGLVSLLIVAEGSEFQDERVVASLPLAPAGRMAHLLGGGAEASSAPMLIMGGMLDLTLPYVEDQLDSYDVAPAPRGLVGIHLAGHFSFTELCDLDLAELATSLGLDVGNVLDDGCGPEFTAPGDQRAIQNYFGAAFFEHFLLDDAEAGERLASDAIPIELTDLIDYQVDGMPAGEPSPE